MEEYIMRRLFSDAEIEGIRRAKEAIAEAEKKARAEIGQRKKAFDAEFQKMLKELGIHAVENEKVVSLTPSPDPILTARMALIK